MCGKSSQPGCQLEGTTSSYTGTASFSAANLVVQRRGSTCSTPRGAAQLQLRALQVPQGLHEQLVPKHALLL